MVAMLNDRAQILLKTLVDRYISDGQGFKQDLGAVVKHGYHSNPNVS